MTADPTLDHAPVPGPAGVASFLAGAAARRPSAARRARRRARVRAHDGDGDGDETLTVVVNFTTASIAYEHAGEIAVSSVAGRDPGPFDGTLAPDEAVVLRSS